MLARVPAQVILGMKYDYALDMWSVGSVIYELFTGRILFPGHSNNQVSTPRALTHLDRRFECTE